MDREEWEIEQERRQMLHDNFITEMRKNKFINDIVSGLGDEIKKEPNKVQKKPSLMFKIKKLLGWN